MQTDLILDVIRAADPEKRSAALSKLDSFSSGPSFKSALDVADKTSASRYARPVAYTTRDVHQSSRVQTNVEFEAVILSSLIQSIIPASLESSFGKGLGGSYVKSLLSEQIAKQIASTAEFGIAKLMESRVSGQSSAPAQTRMA